MLTSTTKGEIVEYVVIDAKAGVDASVQAGARCRVCVGIITNVRIWRPLM